jgi:repressor LexA
MGALTQEQEAVLGLIVRETSAGRPGPTHREIAAHCGFASSYAAAWHVRKLVAMGRLAMTPGKARSVRPVPAEGPGGGLRAGTGGHATVSIPIYGSIPAGFPADREPQAEGCITVDVEELQLRPSARTFALRVQGESMIGVGILDGDLVLLEHGGEPRHGQVVAALIDGQSTLKTFLMKGRRAFLRAENPKYPDLIPAEELMIQGVFRALIRKAR